MALERAPERRPRILPASVRLVTDEAEFLDAGAFDVGENLVD